MNRICVCIMLMLISSSSSFAQKIFNYYVSLSGSDSNEGTIDKPFKTISRAKKQVIATKKSLNSNSLINIYFRKGIYEIDKCIEFSSEDSGSDKIKVVYSNYNNEKVVFSGGVRIDGKWQKKSIANIILWKIDISKYNKDGYSIDQLFSNDVRLPRSSSPIFYTVGPNPQYSPLIKKFDFPGLQTLQTQAMEAICSFSFNPNDMIKVGSDFKNISVIVYNSWEASWHTVRSIDRSNNIIYFKNPLTYPVGFFNNKLRYRIENSQAFLTKPGNWYVDYEKSELWYYGYKSENPNNSDFILPRLNRIIEINGSDSNRVNNLHFRGLNFMYTSSTKGISGIAKLDRERLESKYSWLDFSQGYSSFQAGVQDNQVISFKHVDNCSMSNCKITHIGDYAIRIDKFCSNNNFNNLELSDLGGGGIILGFNESDPIGKNIPFEASPSNNRIQNCRIFNGGIIKPGTVGIVVMQANHNLINNNTIFNFPYSGISVGWTWDSRDNYTSYNTISNNVVHDVMLELADGGGIYTLGKQVGAVYKGNYIYNVGRNPSAIGSANNGFFFDQGSSMFTVDSNAVVNVKNNEYRFNKTDSSKIKLLNNYFQKQSRDIKLFNYIQSRSNKNSN